MATLTARDSKFKTTAEILFQRGRLFTWGIQLLQRMGKLGNKKRTWRFGCFAPRILDLLSRDLNDQSLIKKEVAGKFNN